MDIKKSIVPENLLGDRTNREEKVLKEIRKVAGEGAASIGDIIPDNFIGDEIPDPTRPFVFWSTAEHGYVHVGLVRD